MKKTVALSLVALLSLACCIKVLGLGAEYPPGFPVGGSPDWAEGTGDLVNQESRVFGFFVNANDWFYFAGDTETFNAFLQQYAELEGTPLTLILNPGPGTVSPPWDKEKVTRYEWGMSVLRRGWGAPEATSPEDGKYVVSVDLYLGGQVALDELEVPLNIRVKSGGEIEAFIAEHEAKREANKTGDSGRDIE